MDTPEHILMSNFIGISRGYFDRVASPSLEEARNTTRPIRMSFRIAGANVRVEFYGETLARKLSLALAHHPEATGPADLSIVAWDPSAVGHDMIPPWDEPTFAADRKGLTGEDFLGVYVTGEESLNFYDPRTRTGYFWVHDAERLPDWAVGAPFRTILHWFLGERSIHLMHGAVVGENGDAVLLTARSGSGKSTTALACLLSGMDYLSDDYAAIDEAGTPTAYSLYHSAKITREGLGLFPELREKVWNKDFGPHEKAVFFMSDLFPDQVRTKARLKAIFIPRITGGPTRIVPASGAEALLAIAPTTLLQLPWAETRKLSAFRTIIGKVPCFFLELGPEIRLIPEVVKDFLRSAEV